MSSGRLIQSHLIIRKITGCRKTCKLAAQLRSFKCSRSFENFFIGKTVDVIDKPVCQRSCQNMNFEIFFVDRRVPDGQKNRALTFFQKLPGCLCNIVPLILPAPRVSSAQTSLNQSRLSTARSYSICRRSSSMAAQIEIFLFDAASKNKNCFVAFKSDNTLFEL